MWLELIEHTLLRQSLEVTNLWDYEVIITFGGFFCLFVILTYLQFGKTTWGFFSVPEHVSY